MNSLVNAFNSFVTNFTSFCNSVISILNYIWSIFKTLWYGLTSLLSGAWSLLVDLYNGTLFSYIVDCFYDLSFYFGGPATLFLISLFCISLLSIVIGFVFKIFKLELS